MSTTAKARKGKKRAIVDTSDAVPNSEVHAVFRLRKSTPAIEEGGPAGASDPGVQDFSDEEGPERSDSSKPKVKKRKALSGKLFLDEKRKAKARKRELKGTTQIKPTTPVPTNETKYVHIRVACDPMGILDALLNEEFRGAESLDIAPRMQCAWLTFPTAEEAQAQISKKDPTIAGQPVTVTQGKKAPEDVFISFAGRKLLGAFLDLHFPGAKDVVEATDNALRARFVSKEAARAAVKKGPVKAVGNQTITAVGDWGSEES